jgi:hypothetical protein
MGIVLAAVILTFRPLDTVFAIRIRSITSTIILSNAITVGLLGPVVFAWGNVRGGLKDQHKLNAVTHTLPLILSVFVILGWRLVLNTKLDVKNYVS